MTGTPDLLPDAPDGAPLIEEALALVHLSSAIFLRGEFTAPWAFASLGPQEYTAAFAPGADRLILFHIVLEGRFRIRLSSGEEAEPGAGEAVVLPYGDRHEMGFPREARPRPVGELLPPLPWTTMPVMRQEGGGERTRILCGYLHCEDLLFHPFLRALPPLIHVPPTSARSEWLQASARYAVEEARRGGSPSARLPELLLVDCLRRHLADLPPARTGWLAALHDPVVGPALKLLHQAPAERWTVERLARRVAVSRTVLGERFAAVLGVPPMRYLVQWRLQLAANLLRSSRATLPEIAGRVGYESEAAFSRAFKRGLGLPPAAWRESRSPGGAAPTPPAPG
jgi:AraC family transcriptional regulator, alkane utilization regulator